MRMPLFPRESALRFLRQNKDRETVKILTGLRGAGKSVILSAYRDELLAAGVPAERIFLCDFSRPESPDAEEWFSLLSARYAGGGKAYLLFDEAQALPGFATLADRLFRFQNIDLVLAGSGLSARLAPLRKLLPGRLQLHEVLPLSFAETLGGHPADATALINYTEGSSMPGAIGAADVRGTLDTILSAALFHEMLGNPALRQSLTLRLLALLSAHASELTALPALAEAAGRVGRPLLAKTLAAYLSGLEDAGLLLIHPLLPVADVGEILTVEPDARRFYFPDPAMLSLYGTEGNLPYRQLACAAACELRRREGAVSAGRTSHGLIDFVTGTGALETLWQLIPNPEASYAKEKYETLRAAPARCRKVLLTFEPYKFPEEKGLLIADLPAWFGENEELRMKN